MARATVIKDRTLSEQEALNAIANGVAAARSTDVFVSDAKGFTLSVSTTNASKAIPASVRVIAFWCDVAFRWRLNTTADLTNGAYTSANEIVVLSIDPDDTVVVASLQAILSAGTGTITGNIVFGT